LFLVGFFLVAFFFCLFLVGFFLVAFFFCLFLVGFFLCLFLVGFFLSLFLFFLSLFLFFLSLLCFFRVFAARWVVGFDDDDHLSDIDGFSFVRREFLDRTGAGRGYFGDCFVGFDLAQRVVFFYLVALFDEPFRYLSFGKSFSRIREREFELCHSARVPPIPQSISLARLS
jgi:hypothetical protein